MKRQPSHRIRRPWEANFTSLKKFVAREGHARVPGRHIENGFTLGQWVHHQRKRGKHIPIKCQRAFESLPGWSWNPIEDKWNEAFSILERFAHREGHARVPAKYIDGTFRLGQWVVGQRRSKRRSVMSMDRVRALDSLAGWSWAPKRDDWYESFQFLRQFVKREGHARVPQEHRERDFELGYWVMIQRRDRKRLGKTRVGILESQNEWTWNAYDGSWNDAFALLIQYSKREGHAQVPHRHLEDGFRLGVWVGVQRLNRSKMHTKRKTALETVAGWVWNAFDDRWDQAYRVLEQYAYREGNTLVHCRHEEDGFQLGSWVADQRKLYKRGDLRTDRISFLEETPHWTWSPQEEMKWLRRYECLLEFVQREGHVGVPNDYVEGKLDLGAWIHTQHQEYYDGTISEIRRTKLEAVPLWRWTTPRNKTRPFNTMDIDSQTELVFEILFGLGPVRNEEAIHIVAASLRGQCKLSKISLTINKAIKAAVEYGYLDRPKRGHVHAVIRQKLGPSKRVLPQ